MSCCSLKKNGRCLVLLFSNCFGKDRTVTVKLIESALDALVLVSDPAMIHEDSRRAFAAARQE